MIFLSNFFTLLHRLMIFFHHFSHGTVSILFVFPFKFPCFPRFHEFRKIHRNSTFLSNPGKFPRFKKSPQKPTWKFPRLWQHCDLAADRGKPLELEKNRSLFTIQTRPREFFAFATVFLYVNVVSFEGR